jgi:hypothetical protein
MKARVNIEATDDTRVTATSADYSSGRLADAIVGDTARVCLTFDGWGSRIPWGALDPDDVDVYLYVHGYLSDGAAVSVYESTHADEPTEADFGAYTGSALDAVTWEVEWNRFSLPSDWVRERIMAEESIKLMLRSTTGTSGMVFLEDSGSNRPHLQIRWRLPVPAPLPPIRETDAGYVAAIIAPGDEPNWARVEARMRSGAAVEYDETQYLANNPDVAAAVSGGGYTSGWDHYVQWGIPEGRNAGTVGDSAWLSGVRVPAVTVEGSEWTGRGPQSIVLPINDTAGTANVQKFVAFEGEGRLVVRAFAVGADGTTAVGPSLGALLDWWPKQIAVEIVVKQATTTGEAIALLAYSVGSDIKLARVRITNDSTIIDGTVSIGSSLSQYDQPAGASRTIDLTLIEEGVCALVYARGDGGAKGYYRRVVADADTFTVGDEVLALDPYEMGVVGAPDHTHMAIIGTYSNYGIENWNFRRPILYLPLSHKLFSIIVPQGEQWEIKVSTEYGHTHALPVYSWDDVPHDEGYFMLIGVPPRIRKAGTAWVETEDAEGHMHRLTIECDPEMNILTDDYGEGYTWGHYQHYRNFWAMADTRDAFIFNVWGADLGIWAGYEYVPGNIGQPVLTEPDAPPSTGLEVELSEESTAEHPLEESSIDNLSAVVVEHPTHVGKAIMLAYGLTDGADSMAQGMRIAWAKLDGDGLADMVLNDGSQPLNTGFYPSFTKLGDGIDERVLMRTRCGVTGVELAWDGIHVTGAMQLGDPGIHYSRAVKVDKSTAIVPYHKVVLDGSKALYQQWMACVTFEAGKATRGICSSSSQSPAMDQLVKRWEKLIKEIQVGDASAPYSPPIVCSGDRQTGVILFHDTLSAMRVRGVVQDDAAHLSEGTHVLTGDVAWAGYRRGDIQDGSEVDRPLIAFDSGLIPEEVLRQVRTASLVLRWVTAIGGATVRMHVVASEWSPSKELEVGDFTSFTTPSLGFADIPVGMHESVAIQLNETGAAYVRDNRGRVSFMLVQGLAELEGGELPFGESRISFSSADADEEDRPTLELTPRVTPAGVVHRVPKDVCKDVGWGWWSGFCHPEMPATQEACCAAGFDWVNGACVDLSVYDRHDQEEEAGTFWIGGRAMRRDLAGAIPLVCIDAIENKWLVAMHACHSVTAVFATTSDQDRGLVDRCGGWSWQVEAHEDGLDGMITTVTIEEDPPDPEAGEVLVNVKGMIDGAGALIDSLPDALAHFAENYWGVTDRNDASFAAAKASMDSRGLKLAGAILDDADAQRVAESMAGAHYVAVYCDMDGRLTIQELGES